MLLAVHVLNTALTPPCYFVRNTNDLAKFQSSSAFMGIKLCSALFTFWIPLSSVSTQVSFKLEVCKGVILRLLRIAHSYIYLTIMSFRFVFVLCQPLCWLLRVQRWIKHDSLTWKNFQRWRESCKRIIMTWFKCSSRAGSTESVCRSQEKVTFQLGPDRCVRI